MDTKEVVLTYVAVPRPWTVDTKEVVLTYVAVPRPCTVDTILFVLYTSDPLTNAEFVKNIVLALMLPFTSNNVLGDKGLFIVTVENWALVVLRLNTFRVEVTASVCVLIDCARILDTLTTFRKVELYTVRSLKAPVLPDRLLKLPCRASMPSTLGWAA
ncbi:MAG: hypothetical protein EBU84_13115 [Actinobacteria bacterium]|nr:hypothetical protein [Actinomycetota bacterium]